VLQFSSFPRPQRSPYDSLSSHRTTLPLLVIFSDGGNLTHYFFFRARSFFRLSFWESFFPLSCLRVEIRKQGNSSSATISIPNRIPSFLPSFFSSIDPLIVPLPVAPPEGLFHIIIAIRLRRIFFFPPSHSLLPVPFFSALS